MQTSKLAEVFKSRYHKAEKGYAVTAIHLFGIEYADQLKGHNLKEICVLADIPISYVTEIYKGIRLAEFVKLK
ncbi:MAG: hypothetical protein COB39_14000 [Marinosulfonomonas sp.]|nr:MAG: hypothetical protein COB39_14000 [Marinosulfonomonas sp.]